jgi:hypothetical protein
MTPDHDPPESYRFNKLRESGGSYRLTLVKAAVDATGIDPKPPRQVLALLPVGPGVWIGFDVAHRESQLDRVRARSVATAELDPGARVVGEYPVRVRGKLGSAVVLVPRELVDALALDDAEQATTVAVGPATLLFATERRIDDSDGELAAACEAVRRELDDVDPTRS